MRTEVQNTLDCYHVCTETIQHCLKMGGKHVEQKHLNLMMDCAKICLTMADFLMRNSEYSKKLGSICAAICDTCAKSCEAVGLDDEMKRCIKACKKCAETCKDL